MGVPSHFIRIGQPFNISRRLQGGEWQPHGRHAYSLLVRATQQRSFDGSSPRDGTIPKLAEAGHCTTLGTLTGVFLAGPPRSLPHLGRQSCLDSPPHRLLRSGRTPACTGNAGSSGLQRVCTSAKPVGLGLEACSYDDTRGALSVGTDFHRCLHTRPRYTGPGSITDGFIDVRR